MFTRQFQKSIHDSSFQAVKNIIREEGWEGKYFRILTNTIVSKETGAEAVFLGLDRSSANIMSMEDITMLQVEQAEKAKQEAFDEVLPSVRGDGSQIILIWNPQLPTTPVELFRKHELDGTLSINANYWNNAFLGPEFYSDYERVKTQTPHKLRNIYYGDFLSVSANNPFGKSVDECYREAYSKGSILLAGVDPAWTEGDESDWTAIVIGDELGNKTRKVHFREQNPIKRTERIIQSVKGVDFFVLDSTDSGAQYIQEAAREAGIPCLPIKFNNKVKQNLVRYTADRMAQGRTSYLDDDLKLELQHFDEKQTPSGLATFSAVAGFHDDLVCAYMLYLNACRRWEKG